MRIISSRGVTTSIPQNSQDTESIVGAHPPDVTFFLRDLEGGGAERNTVRLANALHEKGYRVDLVTVVAAGPCLQDVESGVRLIELGSKRAALSVHAVSSYVRAARTPVIISALHHANLTILLAKFVFHLPTRVIVGIRNTLSAERDKARTIKAKLIHKMVDVFYRFADGIVAVSEGVAQDFARTTGIDAKRVTTTYNPVVSPELSRKAQEGVDHPWFHDRTGPVIVSAGRLRPQKDFETLIRAIGLVRDQIEARLVILGEGDQRPKLQQLVDELELRESVALPGFVDNPYPYIASADLFVLSSRFEGLPTVLIEALALGTQVVSTDCKSGPREILAGGDFGRLVPVGSPDKMAQAILDALREPRLAVASEAYRPYTVDAVVDSYRDILISSKDERQ